MSNMVIATNVMALNSHRALKGVGNNIFKASEKLSSGYRINRAADDAAGLAISETMRAQIRSLDQASRNSQDGISLIQTAEGALQEVQNMVTRMRELVIQASNDTYTDGDRDKIQLEIEELVAEIDATAAKTEFNKKVLLDGSLDGNDTGTSVWFQTGANDPQGLEINIKNMDATSLGVGDGTDAVISVADPSGAAIAAANIGLLDTALDLISEQRAQLGAWQNRLEHTVKNLDTTSENLSASESRIRDTDMAKEMMRLTQNNVLQQAATAMLAQANQAPQNILQLLG